MKVFNADVSNSGSGSLMVSVKDKLEAELSGSGDIRYKGDPQEINLKSDGSGNIQKAD